MALTSAVRTPLLPATNALGSLAGEPFQPPTLKVDRLSAARLILKTFHDPPIVFAPPLPMSAQSVEAGNVERPEVLAERLIALPHIGEQAAVGSIGVSMVLLLICSEPVTLLAVPPMYWIPFAPT